MTINSFLVRNVLRNYDQQLTSARRLARLKRSLRAAGSMDEVTISREAKRKEMVDWVSRELLENMLVAGSTNLVVLDIKSQLEQEFGEEFEFNYPVTGEDLQVFVRRDDEVIELVPPEKNVVLSRLWELTRLKVSETML